MGRAYFPLQACFFSPRPVQCAAAVQPSLTCPLPSRSPLGRERGRGARDSPRSGGCRRPEPPRVQHRGQRPALACPRAAPGPGPGPDWGRPGGSSSRAGTDRTLQSPQCPRSGGGSDVPQHAETCHLGTALQNSPWVFCLSQPIDGEMETFPVLTLGPRGNVVAVTVSGEQNLVALSLSS